MTDIQKKIKPEQILEIILKRHWFIIIPFCISMIIGTFLVIKLPRVYEAKTVILVQPQKVPTNIVQDIVASDINARISTLSQQILSRSNLEKIIEDFNLYSGPGNEKMFLDKKVENLEKRISVKVTQGVGKNADSFSISFRGTDPEKVMMVTSSLASSFIDENLKIRETQAVGTNTFLEDELETMRKRLIENEQRLKDYREINMGGLPEQLDSNLRILDNLNERLTSVHAELRDARVRLSNLHNSEFEVTNPVNTPRVNNDASTEPSNLAQMREQLENYKARYTENHPDVVRLKKMVAELESQMKKNDSGKSLSGSRGTESNRSSYNPTYIQQKRNITNEVNRLEMEKNELVRQISSYKKRVEDTPKREQELQTLQRDYENIDTTYNSLLGRQLEAQIAMNMEKKQKGEQFRVLDPARLPESPVSPDLNKLFLFVLAAGLGIGAGLIFIVEFLDSSFKEPEDIENFLNIPVLATLPTVMSDSEHSKNRRQLMVSISGIAVSFILLATFMGSIAMTR